MGIDRDEELAGTALVLARSTALRVPSVECLRGHLQEHLAFA